MVFDMSEYFNLFNLPSGRRLVAMREMLPIAQEFEYDELVAHLEKAIMRERELLALERRWRAARDGAHDEPVSHGELREARIWGQNRLLRAVAQILSKYEEDDPESVRARITLMRPVVEQHDMVHLYLRAGRKVRDIDPDTGEITDEVDLEQPAHIEIGPPPAQA